MQRSEKNFVDRWSFLFLSIILLGAFLVRLYKFNGPIADWHSWRQADTAAVTRNFIKFGPNIFTPRFDDLSNIPSGKDNPYGYRFVEFPIYNLASLVIFKIGSFLPLTVEEGGRLTSIIFSLFSIYFLFKIAKIFWNTTIALFSAFFFAFLPYNVYYSRTILPEPALVAFSLATLYFFIEHSRNKKTISLWLLFSLITSACAFLIKPTATFLLLPLFYLIIDPYKFSKKTFFYFILYAFFSLVPLLLWRKWMSQFPEGIPAWSWLLNGDGIRFKGAFFYWLFAERISKLILGYWGIGLLVLGFFHLGRKKSLFILSLTVSLLLYFVIIATGNVKHDYYQIIIIPLLSLLLAFGAEALILQKKTSSYFLILILVAFTFAFSWYEVRTYYWINKPEIVTVGKIADSILPKEAKVIAPYGGDTAFLYQTNRQGWPIGFNIEDKIKEGANYYISLDPHDWETTELAKKYPVFKKGDNFEILKLQ